MTFYLCILLAITGGTGLPGGLGGSLGSGTVSGLELLEEHQVEDLDLGGHQLAVMDMEEHQSVVTDLEGHPLGGYGPRGVPAGGYGPGSGGMLTNIILHKCSLGILFVSIFILCI